MAEAWPVALSGQALRVNPRSGTVIARSNMAVIRRDVFQPPVRRVRFRVWETEVAHIWDTEAGENLKRKLTTIFYADVQNYSALMAADEANTLSRLKRYRAIMSRLFDRCEGRQVNTWGDAVIAEFDSVVEAVRCSVEIQDALSAENRVFARAQSACARFRLQP